MTCARCKPGPIQVLRDEESSRPIPILLGQTLSRAVVPGLSDLRSQMKVRSSEPGDVGVHVDVRKRESHVLVCDAAVLERPDHDEQDAGRIKAVLRERIAALPE